MGLLDDISLYRGNGIQGYLPLAFLEKFYNINPVQISYYEPDPETFRDEYYYNSRFNILYKKLTTAKSGCSNSTTKIWKAISER